MSEAPEATQDRRENDRAAITLRVDYKRLNTFFADYTKNISKGGTFIRTTKPLDVGTEFVFVLSFPSAEGQLKLRGEVMWVVAEDASSADGPAGMGIRFLFESEDEKRGVHEFVERLMTDSLGSHIANQLMKGRPPSSPGDEQPPTRRPV